MGVILFSGQGKTNTAEAYWFILNWNSDGEKSPQEHFNVDGLPLVRY